MKKTQSAVLLVVMAIGLGLFSVPTVTSNEENAPGIKKDAARIERKFEIRNLARQIFNKADRREREAAENSPTVRKNNEDMMKELDKCFADADGRLGAVRRGKLSAYEARRLLDSCMNSAIKKNPNGRIISELRDEFVEEELKSLRDSMEEQGRRDLREEIRGLSV